MKKQERDIPDVLDQMNYPAKVQGQFLNAGDINCWIKFKMGPAVITSILKSVEHSASGTIIGINDPVGDTLSHEVKRGQYVQLFHKRPHISEDGL